MPQFLTNINLSKLEIQNAALHKLGTAPLNPALGQIYFNTGDNKPYIYNGTSWVDLSQQDTDTVTRIKGGASGTLTSGDINLLAGSNISITQSANDITITGASGSLTFTGDVTGTGTTGSSTALTLANSGVTAGTYKSVTVDGKGRVTSGSNPTTLSGYGITDAQPLDADLTAIAALTGTSGLLKKTAADTWTLDTNTYLTGNQTVTISGDATGSGATAIALTLANSGVTAGTYNNSATAVTPITVDAKGRVTGTGAAITITPAWSSITSKPTTISGFGITDAYTKTEVDNLITGLEFKSSVKAISTSNITLSGAQTIDGVSLVAGDRVLVAGQTTSSQNGIYVVASGSWTRAIDFDNTPGTEVATGAYVFVDQGTTYANSGWVLSTTGTITIGTTGLTFVQFNGLAQVTAGAGLSKSGNTLSLASVTQSSGSSFVKLTIDSYGRVSGNTAVALSDLTVLGAAPSASPAFSGIPTAPTAAADTNTTQLATTAFVIGQGYLKSSTASSTYAPLASPALTGIPTAPTASLGTNTTQLATTAFVQSAIANTKYIATIGDGTATSFVLTHNLGTRSATVTIMDNTDYSVVYADVEMTTINTATIRFGVVPATNKYTVTITA